MQAYMSEDDFVYYDKLLSDNWQGMLVLDELIIPRMFGYASRQDYYE